VRVLVDTHTWLWMLASPARLPGRVRDAVGDMSTEVLLSAASSWEIAIKFQLGKLALPEAPTSFVPSRLAASGCTGVAIEHAHTLRAGLLPPHHRDPFDRLLIAQAQILGAPLASGDRVFDAYDVELLWD
jgi:PIN domain nuclease of toxin-antitoxin system